MISNDAFANETDEKTKKNKLHEDRFVLLNTPLSLQELAGYQIVVPILYNYISRSEDMDHFEAMFCSSKELSDHCKDECWNLVNCLNIPKCLENLLKNQIRKVVYRVYKFITRLRRCIGLNSSTHYLNNVASNRIDPYHLVWLSNGKIDYKKSATNLCRSTVYRTAPERFILMCKFGLEEEIETFPMQWLPNETSNLSEEYLVYYWICYRRNELDKIPLLGYHSAEAAIASKCTLHEWLAFECLWNRMNANDRLSLVRNLVLNDLYEAERIVCKLHRLFHKLSLHEQRLILSEVPTEIFTRFYLNTSTKLTKYEQYTLWIWILVKELFTVRDLLALMDFLVLQSRESRKKLLLLIWDKTPGHLKDCVNEYVAQKIVPLLANSQLCSTDFSLLCKYVKDQPLENKYAWKNILKNSVVNLANFTGDPRSMCEFIDVCLPDINDRLEFKKLLANSPYFRYSCFRLIGCRKLFYVDLKLKCCFPDENDRREYKNDLIMQSRVFEKDVYFYNIENWHQFNNFIDQIFPEDKSLAKNKKKQLVLLFANSWPHHRNIKDANNTYYKSTRNLLKGLNNLIKAVEMVFAVDELRTVKNAFFRSIVKFRKNYNKLWRLNFMRWEFFHKFIISWCLGEDENAIAEFKRNYSVDDVFDDMIQLAMLYSCTRRYLEPVYEDIDNILKWYLGDIEQVKRYKLRKVDECEDFTIFHMFMQRVIKRNFDQVLKWLTNDDVTVIPMIRNPIIKSAKERLSDHN